MPDAMRFVGPISAAPGRTSDDLLSGDGTLAGEAKIIHALNRAAADLADARAGGTQVVTRMAPSGALPRRYQRAGRDYQPWRMRSRARRT